MGTTKSRAITSLVENKGPGATFTTAGALPSGSAMGWTTAYPDADSTRPDTLPEAIAATMETDPDVEAQPTPEKTSRGPHLSIAGAMPGGSETNWKTAYPSPDPTRPETMPTSMAVRDD